MSLVAVVVALCRSLPLPRCLVLTHWSSNGFDFLLQICRIPQARLGHPLLGPRTQAVICIGIELDAGRTSSGSTSWRRNSPSMISSLIGSEFPDLLVRVAEGCEEAGELALRAVAGQRARDGFEHPVSVGTRGREGWRTGRVQSRNPAVSKTSRNTRRSTHGSGPQTNTIASSPFGNLPSIFARSKNPRSPFHSASDASSTA